MTKDPFNQHFFFQNNAGISIDAKNGVNYFEWQQPVIVPNKVIPYDLQGVKPAPFSIRIDHSGFHDIVIDAQGNKFLNFLINTSRICWRRELALGGELQFRKNKFNIESPVLHSREQFLQKHHLINKIYALGYLLHDYKDWEKPWAVCVMDAGSITGTPRSFGTGKSVFIKAVSQMQNCFTLQGRNPKLTNNQFIYNGVTAETDLIHVDDSHERLDLSFFFSAISGPMKIDRKGERPLELPYKYSPKFVFTGPYHGKQDPSTVRRLLYVVFSDYYNQERSVKDDFDGKLLFEDFSTKDWNDMFWLFAYCVHFYLTCDKKFNPPTL